jgi:hypothetical protein
LKGELRERERERRGRGGREIDAIRAVLEETVRNFSSPPAKKHEKMRHSNFDTRANEKCSFDARWIIIVKNIIVEHVTSPFAKNAKVEGRSA